MRNRPGIDTARDALKRHFGYNAFRPGQAEVIASVLRGNDTLAVLPTGGGKSVCYQVPAVLLPGITLVISPLISLMQDQVTALIARGLAAAFINSTLSRGEIAARLREVREGALKLLYMAPERFEFGDIADQLRSAGVSLLAVDEAHCISEWGHDFRPSYLRLNVLRDELGNPPVAALTATATPRVRRDITRVLCLRNPTVIVTGFDRANLDYHVLRVKRPAEKDAHLRALIGARSREVIIVYASTRGTVSRVASMLRKSGVAAAGYHAGLHERRRAEAQEAFMTGRARVLVATNAFGMGIDKPDVRMVIHYSMPGTLEAYYQEAGRAGRDGLHSTCVLLYSFADRFTHEYFLRVRAPSTETLSRVSAAVREACAASGSFDASWLTSHAAGRLGVSRAELESCVAILARGGLLVAVPPDTGIVVVRLLATPERIVRELAGNEMRQQLGLLRMLWRMFGRDLEPGVTVRMDRLRARGNSVPTMRKLLTDLQARQFLSLKYASPAWRRVTTGPTPAWSRNLAALERRRMAELAKLVAMENYARTRSCRRAFVLRYFGDTSRLSPSVCCDNCGCPIPGADALHSNAAGLRRHRQMSLRLGSKDR